MKDIIQNNVDEATASVLFGSMQSTVCNRSTQKIKKRTEPRFQATVAVSFIPSSPLLLPRACMYCKLPPLVTRNICHKSRLIPALTAVSPTLQILPQRLTTMHVPKTPNYPCLSFLPMARSCHTIRPFDGCVSMVFFGMLVFKDVLLVILQTESVLQTLITPQGKKVKDSIRNQALKAHNKPTKPSRHTTNPTPRRPDPKHPTSTTQAAPQK